MSPADALHDFTLGLDLFGELVQAHPRLRAAFVESQARFGPPPADASEEERQGHARRCLEWFLFEAVDVPTSGLPAEELLDAWRESAAGELSYPEELYLQSITGVFAVLGPAEEGGLELREMAGLTRIQLASVPAIEAAQPGDLLVGRLFPFTEGFHCATPALALVRSPAILEALERDLDRLREGRAHALLRLSQLELERMFWTDGGATHASAALHEGAAAGASTQDGAHDEAPGDPVGELERFLENGDVSPATIENWKRVLSRAPFDPRRVVAGVDDVVANLLEQLAFETELDLEAARQHLLLAWPRLAARGVQRAQEANARRSQPPAPPEEVAASLEELDRDRAAGLDVEASFDALERRLGLDEEDDAAGDAAPDFPGVVGAMVEEFLWETEVEHGAETRARLEGLRLFGESLQSVGVFENVGPNDVLGFLTFRLPESGAVEDPLAARDLVDALNEFAIWAEETHGVALVDAELAVALQPLRDSLARAIAANALLEVADPEQDELFELVGVTEEGALVRDASNLEREVAANTEVVAALRPGDLFRGHTLDDGTFRIGRCYPPEAARLKQRTV